MYISRLDQHESRAEAERGLIETGCARWIKAPADWKRNGELLELREFGYAGLFILPLREIYKSSRLLPLRGFSLEHE